MKQIKIGKNTTDRSVISLDRYLRDISIYPMITTEREMELTLIIRDTTSDNTIREAAITELTQANLRFVVSVAKHYQSSGLPLSDLINEGNIGLIKAAQRFDHTRGFKFISYAVRWIRQSILSAVAEDARGVRLPANKIGEISSITKYMGQLEQKLHRSPTTEELAEVMGIETDKTKELQTMIHSTVIRTDDPININDSSTIEDMLVDTLYGNIVEEEMQQEHQQYCVSELMKILNAGDKNILSMYYGLAPYTKRHTFLEIAQKYDISSEMVRQKINRSMKRMKNSSAGAKIREQGF